jgi:hypothetical protein
MSTELLSERIKLFDELLKQKITQATSLKESLKPVDAFNAATKELCNKVDEIIKPKKLEMLDLLSSEKLSGETYRYFFNIFESILSLTRGSKLDTEKMLFSKQQELNFLANEYTKLKELQEKVIAEVNKKQIDLIEIEPQNKIKDSTQAEYVRPDQNPNTRIGKAAMDIQARKKSVKNNDETQ